MKFMNKLEDKRMLMSRGTSGIGRAMTEGYVEFGANVVLSGPELKKT